MEAAGEDEDAVATTSSLLSVRDSVSWAPIQVPVRGLACMHAQCFDLNSFLQLHQRPSFKRWQCPICSKVRGLCHEWCFACVAVVSTPFRGGGGGRCVCVRVVYWAAMGP